MRIPTLLSVVLVPAVIALIPPEAASQSSKRVVYATVVNRAGVPVDHLLAADFLVKENGSARNVVSDGSYQGRADKRDDVRAALGESGATLYEVVIARSEAPYAYSI